MEGAAFEPSPHFSESSVSAAHRLCRTEAGVSIPSGHGPRIVPSLGSTLTLDAPRVTYSIAGARRDGGASGQPAPPP